jgi:hypothetical protein
MDRAGPDRAPTTLIGVDTIGGITDSAEQGKAAAFKYDAVASGMLTNLWVYLDANSATTHVEVGLYADDGGSPSRPSNRLASCGLSHPANAVGGWYGCVATGTAVTSGTAYWIAILSTAGTIRTREGSDPGGGAQNSWGSQANNLLSLPDPFGTTDGGYSVKDASFYGAD